MHFLDNYFHFFAISFIFIYLHSFGGKYSIKSNRRTEGEAMFGNGIRIHHHIFAGPQPGFMNAEQSVNYHAVLAMETGSFEFEIEEIKGQASFGDLVFCPAGINFKRKALSEVSFHHFQFELLPDPDVVPVSPPLEGKITLTDTARLKSTFTYLRKLQNSKKPVVLQTKSIRDQLVTDILLLCELERLLTDSFRRHSDPLMQQAMNIIQQQAFDPDIQMQDIAGRLGLSPSQLTRRFQSVYGSKPAAYLTKLRLEEAKRLLVETNDTLESIAYRCGFDNGSYFCRVFTGKTGTNPSVFRHNNWI